MIQGPLELAHVLGVDPEVGLERDLDVDALGDQMNDPPDHTAELSAANLLSFAGSAIAQCSRNSSSCSLRGRWSVGQEQDALLLQVLADLVVDDLALVLGGHPGDQARFSASGMPRRS